MVRGSSVGKATRYGLYGAGIEISCTCLDRPRGAVFSDCHNKIRPFLSTRPFCIINVKCVLCDVCTASYVQFACMTVYLGQGTSGNLQSFPGYISVLLVPILNAKFNTLRNLSPAGSLCCGLFTSVVAAPGGGGGENRDPQLQYVCCHASQILIKRYLHSTVSVLLYCTNAMLAIELRRAAVYITLHTVTLNFPGKCSGTSHV